MDHESQQIRMWLNEKGIQVPDGWVVQCLAFVKKEMAEKGITNFNVDTIAKQVFEQWTLADLRELSCPVFPKFVTTARRVVLTGTYCVQVNSMIDIGVSAYSQLQKCMANEGDNTEIDIEAAEEAKPWEPKPTRMYKLELFDGLLTVTGIEDRPIQALHPGLLPGFKVRLHGRIESRKGILFLNPDNVDVLDGNTEPLIEENSLVKTLKRKLAAFSPRFAQ